MTARALHIPLSPLKKQQQLLGKALAHCADRDEADVCKKRFVGDGCGENQGICSIDYVVFVYYYYCAVMEWLNIFRMQLLGGLKLLDAQQTCYMSPALDIRSCI